MAPMFRFTGPSCDDRVDRGPVGESTRPHYDNTNSQFLVLDYGAHSHCHCGQNYLCRMCFLILQPNVLCQACPVHVVRTWRDGTLTFRCRNAFHLSMAVVVGMRIALRQRMNVQKPVLCSLTLKNVSKNQLKELSTPVVCMHDS